MNALTMVFIFALVIYAIAYDACDVNTARVCFGITSAVIVLQFALEVFE